MGNRVTKTDNVMKVIIGCEYSQAVTKSFRAKGHDAWSCDILPTDGNPEWHYQEDIYEVLKREKFDIGIFHPPCTYLCNSGVGHLISEKLKKGFVWSDKLQKYYNPERWILMEEGAKFFKTLWESDIPKIGMENPIMHKYAKEIIGVNQSQVIQPWMFGHMEKKATCLWLKNLPLLVPTNNVKVEMEKLPQSEQQRLHWLPPSKDRWKIRSTTYKGLAEAMSFQWQ